MLFALALLALVLVVLAGLLELGARLFWVLPPQMAEFHNQGLYCQQGDSIGLTPRYRGTFRFGDGQSTRIHVNRMGLRGEEVPPRRRGVPRVLCVGDSVVFGYGVEDHDALPQQLQEHLRVDARNVVIGNAGIPSFGTVLTTRRLLELIPVFDPDLVVFGVYLGNDFTDDRVTMHTVCGGNLFSGPMAHLMQHSLRARLSTHSRFLLWLETWLATNATEWSPLRFIGTPEWQTDIGGMPEPGRTNAGLFLDVIDPQHTWRPGQPPPVPVAMATLRQSLQTAKAALGDRPLVVLILPTVWHCDEAMWAERLRMLEFDPAEFRFGALRERVAAVAAELGLPSVDPVPTLAALGRADHSFLDGGHLSRSGGHAVAILLAETVGPLLP
ncbi:MAG: SGNH/GDSL hydrolase family protein [Planctomycetota bacterium]